MNVTDLPRAVLRLQYRIARLPWLFVERRVVRKWDEDAPARLLYERSFGAVDAAVGRALGDVDLEARGDAYVKHGENLSAANRLDDDAAKTEQVADDELRARRDKAAAASEQAHAAAVKRAERARDAAEERKQEAADIATQRMEAVKEKIDDAAEDSIEAVEEMRRRRDQSIAAAQKSATAAAEAKLDAARKKRRDAARTQARADRLAELADAEKQTRQRARGRS
jgi:hypothetical protein